MTTPGLPHPVAFVLGGGGSLGAVQVGMLQALTAAGIFPDLVIGTSVGSLNGSVVASDPHNAASRLSRIWPRITRRMVFPGGPLAQIRTLQHERTHLFPNTGVQSVINTYLHTEATFADLALPFGAVTTDVTTAAPHVISQGGLLPALLASTAIPGIFPPVSVDGRSLYDGGVVANVPVTQALAMGARSLVVLDAVFPGRLPWEPKTLAETLLFTAIVTMRTQSALETPLAASRVPVVYLPGPPLHRVSPLEFDHTVMLIEGGYLASKAFLENLAIAGPGLYGPAGMTHPAVPR
jgi:NTE family protein